MTHKQYLELRVTWNKDKIILNYSIASMEKVVLVSVKIN